MRPWTRASRLPIRPAIKKTDTFSISGGSGFNFVGIAHKIEPTPHFIEKIQKQAVGFRAADTNGLFIFQS
jgi:hypothetical protein